MSLVSFQAKAASKDGRSAISAKDLDDNFARVSPLAGQDGSAPQYSVTQTPQGWRLDIFPPFPSGPGPFVLGFNGQGLVWIPTEGCE